MTSRLFFASALVLAGCTADNAVVGGDCKAGFAEANGACVALVDAPPGAAAPGAPNRFGDGTATPLSAENESASGGSSGGAAGEKPGTTGTTSSASTVATGEAGGAGDAGGSIDAKPPALECDAPLVACRGACIPVAADADNCGACGKICPSNICVEGECQGAIAGDVVVLGHDYASSWSTSAQAKMLTNAVSIPTTDPIRILSFDGGNPGAAAERALISSTVKLRGVSFDEADDSTLQATDLARRYDVVLIHAAGGEPDTRGALWSNALETFTKKGGIVVALDDGSSDMPALLRASGLLGIDGHERLDSGTHVLVTAPNDAIGVQVLSPFSPTGASVGFVGVAASSDVTIVARAGSADGLPTAIHRFVSGG